LVSVCVVTFSPVYRDARVLRQVQALAPRFAVTAIGYGTRPESFPPDVVWHSLDDEAVGPPTRLRLSTRIRGRALFELKRVVRFVLLGLVGRIVPPVNAFVLWQKDAHRRARAIATDLRPDIVHANDWDALAVAGEVRRRTGASVVFDAHEYAPLEYANRLSWRIAEAPLRRYVLRRYARDADASMTVAGPIAERLRDEYGLQPIVVFNAPSLGTRPPRAATTDPARIRMIHHGGASRDREPERMIHALALSDDRFTLEFMLLGDAGYISQLQDLAARVAPGKVTFRDPVHTDAIVDTLRAYDLGLYILPPNNYNHRIAMPNKFFDFLVAGLAVCIGPSEAMADIVNRYGCGVVAPSFEPRNVAVALNALDAPTLCRLQDASLHAAATEFNADAQMAKMLTLYQELAS
jgi:hypothetical protein